MPRKHECWDTAKLPKPRQETSGCSSRVRITDIPFALHLLLIIVDGVLPEEYFAGIRYDCSSYFLELDVERLRSVVSSLSSYAGTFCTVVYEFVPNIKAFELNPVCAYAAHNVTENAIVSAFGFPWGCPRSRMSVRITSYYSVVLHVDGDETSGVSVTHQTKCFVNSLNYEANTTVDCLMNEYGGYFWSTADPNGLCQLEEFENISSGLIEILKESVVFCSYRMFLYIGYLNFHKNDERAKRASEVVGALSHECENSPAWIFDSMYFDFLYLMDLVLYTYCNDEQFVAHANESFPIVFELLNTFVNTLTSYYDIRTERLFHRSRMFHVHSIPLEGLQSTQLTCGEQFNVTIVKAYFPLTVACTGQLYALAENDLFEMFLSAGFLKIQPESEKKFEVVIHYNLPEFHQPSEYLCARYEDTTPLSKSSLGGCSLKTVGKYTVSCRCLRPGYYALLQDRPLSGDFDGRILNFLNKPTTRVTHTGVIAVVSISIVLYGAVLCAEGTLRKLREANIQHDRRKGIELLASCLPQQVSRIISIINAESLKYGPLITTDCTVFYVKYDFVGDATKWSLVPRAVVFYVASPTMPNEVRLAGNRKTIGACKAENCEYGARNTFEDSKMIGAVLAITAGVLLYLFYGSHYNQLNCLPDDFMDGMVYPSVAFNLLALMFLSLYWCTRPYRNIDEWFGIFLNVTMSLYVWVQFAVNNEDRFRMRVVRLTTLTLAHPGQAALLYVMYFSKELNRMNNRLKNLRCRSSLVLQFSDMQTEKRYWLAPGETGNSSHFTSFKDISDIYLARLNFVDMCSTADGSCCRMYSVSMFDQTEHDNVVLETGQSCLSVHSAKIQGNQIGFHCATQPITLACVIGHLAKVDDHCKIIHLMNRSSSFETHCHQEILTTTFGR
ncbi:hypothetical protein CLF_111983 [Clonorchis sinensis]|uniref:Uncharacterized protein n=1 Tax=Clonorchis sinensis TaxID=79923 RepID=G7YVM4_CLOSI|nr:hypothetical protein CLF_111983 [Clonorchis sinensis]